MTIKGTKIGMPKLVKYGYPCQICKDTGRTILVAMNPSSHKRKPSLRLCAKCRNMFLKEQFEKYVREHTYPSAMFLKQKEKEKKRQWIFQRCINYEEYKR